MQSPADLGLPFDNWRPGQTLAIRTALSSKTRHTVIQAPTGCIVGDSQIFVNRGGNCTRYAIKTAYKNQSMWRADLASMTRSFDGTRVGSFSFNRVVYSGRRRDVMELTLVDGKALQATSDHLILTPEGYVALQDLTPTMRVICDTPLPRKGNRSPIKLQYLQTQGLKFHKFANGVTSAREGRLYRVASHRLVVEAHINGLPLSEFIRICRQEPEAAQGLVFLDPEVFIVHHRDENTFNNSSSNLEILSHDAHARLHGDEGHFSQGVPQLVRVAHVRAAAGEHRVYDVQGCEDHHNFVANGIVVHNSGKSAIAAGIMALDDRRHVLLTATKGLEDQYTGLVDTLFDVRGMSNYPCRAATDQFKRVFERRRGIIMCDEGPCRSGSACALKDNGCDYFDARREALAARSVLTNYSYWLAMRRYGGGLGQAHRLICDEAHDLCDQLMSACRIEIPIGLLEGNPPTSARVWAEWASQMVDELQPKADTAEDIRVRRTRLVDQLEHLTRIDDTWAWDVRDTHIAFEPTIPRLLLGELAGKDIPSLVYLSATITPSTLKLLNIDDSDVTFQVMKSRYDVRRRPVYVVSTCRIDHRMTADHVAFWLARIDKIISGRLDRKGIIHTISYQRARDILAASKHRGIMLAPQRSSDLARTLHEFRTSPAPRILLSPSITTGFDFPMRDAEYQIVAKMPFPDTRSAITKARIKATPAYRDHLTMQTLVQACGRLMRGPDDLSETFIIDDHAKWALPRAWKEGLLPLWFWESVSFVKGVPPPPPHLE